VHLKIGRTAESLKFEIDSAAVAKAREWDQIKRRKLQRILPILQSPICQGGNSFNMLCESCGLCYGYRDSCVNMIPEKLSSVFKIDETENVSHHPYSEEANRVIKDVRERGGFILDCGAGYRFNIAHDIICLDIVPYPSTDVLGVGQALPFKKTPSKPSFLSLFLSMSQIHLPVPKR
jgi:hypothetical protein